LSSWGVILFLLSPKGRPSCRRRTVAAEWRFDHILAGL
jgi:hypothetical protein